MVKAAHTWPSGESGSVGCGLMGAGIAEVCARAGLDVIVVEASDDAAKAGQGRIEASLLRAAERGKVADVEQVLSRVRIGSDLAPLADRELVVEAIVEIEDAKTALFRHLDEIVEAPDAILASNTSSIPIMKIAVVVTRRPAQVLGIHFFNPVPVLSLVELVPSLLTSKDTTEQARTFVQDVLGKHTIDCQDRAGSSSTPSWSRSSSLRFG